MGVNVWDEAGILPMAIRMRKAGRCPADIDALYGNIIVSIVRMATYLLPKENPGFSKNLDDMLRPDVQSAMTVHALRSAEKFVDTRSNPRSIVNYITKAVQSRLRNYVRDTSHRAVLGEQVPECSIGCDIDAFVTEACDIVGRKAWVQRDARIRNENSNNTQGDRNG